MRPSRLLIASAVVALTATAARAVPAPEPKSQAIDVVVCLDVSGSMNGLIDSAKRKLWTIVNDLAKIRPTPNLRVALYSYGHVEYDPKAGWVRKNLDLTVDLDEAYKQLVAPEDEWRRRIRRPRHQGGARRTEVVRREGRPQADLRLRQRAGRPGQGSHLERCGRTGQEGRRRRQHDLLRAGRPRRDEAVEGLRGDVRRQVRQHRPGPRPRPSLLSRRLSTSKSWPSTAT